MAVPVKGISTAVKSNMSGNSKTIPHTQIAGSNRLITVQLTSGNQQNHTSLTYGGQALTRYYNVNRGNLGLRSSFWYLVDPPTGTNNAVIGFGGSLFNPISVCIKSFKDSGGVGVKVAVNGNSAITSSPKTQSITVENDSLIQITSSGNTNYNTTSGAQIPTGTNQPCVNHNINKVIMAGAISSDAGHSAGSVSVRAASGGSITLDVVEIKGLGGGGSSRRRIIIC